MALFRVSKARQSMRGGIQAALVLLTDMCRVVVVADLGRLLWSWSTR